MRARRQKCTWTHKEGKEFLQASLAHKSTGSPDRKTSIFGILSFHLCLPLMRSLPPSSFQSLSVPQTFLQDVLQTDEQQGLGNRSIYFKMRGVVLQCRDTVTIFLSLSPLPLWRWVFQQLLQVFSPFISTAQRYIFMYFVLLWQSSHKT